MKTLIIYYSEYKDHTKKVAEAMSEILGAEMVHANNTKDIKIENYDLIGFGSGVYNQNMHTVIFDLAEKYNLNGKNVFVFSTSAAGIEMYNKKLIEKLTLKGAVVKGEFCCKGYLTNKFLKLFGGMAKGHPNNEDLLNAKNFAKKLLY